MNPGLCHQRSTVVRTPDFFLSTIIVFFPKNSNCENWPVFVILSIRLLKPKNSPSVLCFLFLPTAISPKKLSCCDALWEYYKENAYFGRENSDSTQLSMVFLTHLCSLSWDTIILLQQRPIDPLRNPPQTDLFLVITISYYVTAETEAWRSRGVVCHNFQECFPLRPASFPTMDKTGND